MGLLATLIALAAWCGQPNNYWTIQQVNQCRQTIWNCLKEHPKSSQCFLDNKLGENKSASKKR